MEGASGPLRRSSPATAGGVLREACSRPSFPVFALLFVGLREGRQQSLCDGDDMMVGVAVTTAVKVVGGAKST